MHRMMMGPQQLVMRVCGVCSGLECVQPSVYSVYKNATDFHVKGILSTVGVAVGGIATAWFEARLITSCVHGGRKE